MRTGRVLTKHFEHEPRQHDLFGLDLGEGPRRRVILIGFASLVIWFGGCIAIFGPPNRVSFSVYFLPPMLVTMYGAQRVGRRMQLTKWVLSLRFALLDHRPIIRAGAKRPSRAEYLPFWQRWKIGPALAHKLWPATQKPAWAAVEDDDSDEAGPRQRAGRPINLNQRANVLGSQDLYQLLTRRRRGNR